MSAAVQDIWKQLTEVKDPELPNVDIVEMGIVRQVTVDNDQVQVTITPTYSGCPAMQMIQDDIVTTLRNYGHASVKIATVFAPPWSSDMLAPSAKEKLKSVGIAPPRKACLHRSIAPFSASEETIHCPFCDSTNTEKRSQFGSTACKAVYFCNACVQPFDYFKSI